MTVPDSTINKINVKLADGNFDIPIKVHIQCQAQIALSFTSSGYNIHHYQTYNNIEFIQYFTVSYTKIQ